METFVEFLNSTNTNITIITLDCNNKNEQTEMVIIIIGLLAYFIASGLGSCLFLGIIHYEKFGQDPQKRSFSDQIFTFNCVMFMIASFVYYTVSEIRWLFGVPLGYFLTTLKYYAFSAILCIPLGCTESILFRCLKIFFWKKCAMLNEDFLATFFNGFNFIIAQMISVIRMMTGQFHHRELFSIISGVDFYDQEDKGEDFLDVPK